jgi:import receptor subunit TOM70
LIGDTDGAKADLEESVRLVPSLTQSWVKLASVYMEQGDATKTFEAFEEATKHNASDPDIYYHRGQGNAQTNNHRLPLHSCRHSTLYLE